MDVPSERDAARIAADFTGMQVRFARRFPLGLANFVYDVVLSDGRRVVVRLAAERSALAFDGAKFWTPKLRALGLPVPSILSAGEYRGRPFLVLQHLPGADLGPVYRDLTSGERRGIAAELARLQGLVGSLPEGDGFGYVAHWAGPFPHETWMEVLLASLQQARQQIEAVGVFPSSLVDGVARDLDRCAPYLETVRATAFLDDTTTKNVLVGDGRLSGIVDIDGVCYGDPLFPIGLTWAALTAEGAPTDYVKYWIEAVGPTPRQRAGLRFYEALFCLILLSETGHRFNREQPIAYDSSKIRRLAPVLGS